MYPHFEEYNSRGEALKVEHAYGCGSPVEVGRPAELREESEDAIGSMIVDRDVCGLIHGSKVPAGAEERGEGHQSWDAESPHLGFLGVC